MSTAAGDHDPATDGATPTAPRRGPRAGGPGLRARLDDHWRAFSRELPGAHPLPPFPLNAVSRGLILGLFLAFAATGGLAGPAPWTAASVLIVLGTMAASELAFVLAWRSRDRARLLRAWAWVLPLDLLALNTAAAADSHGFSLFSIVAIATVHTASSMFSTRYVLALTGIAAAATYLANSLPDLLAGEPNLGMPAFAAVMLAGVGGFATNRGRAETALRHDLVAAQGREREHVRSLEAALEAARASETRFMAFSDNAPAALLLLDRTGQLLFSSRQTARVFGEPDPAARDPEVYVRGLIPAERERINAAKAAAIGGAVARTEFRYRALDGSERHLSSIWFPFGKGAGAGAIITDVTRQRELAAQVIRSQQMETVGTLAGGVAHDFNNLLTAILGNLYMARAGVLEGSIADTCLADAELAVERGAQLVRQLLDYARPRVEDVRPVDLAQLVEETTKLAGRGFTPAIALEVELPPRGLTVDGNFAALQQVLMNLCLNARDAMAGGGGLAVRYRLVQAEAGWPGAGQLPPGPYHAISVSDTGGGISDADLKRIFDPFFTTKEVGKGTGLGLSTALAILRAHGGWMDVETKVGEGSTFRILLPAGTEEPRLAAVPAAATSAA